jgi:hypothetical protein
MPSNYNHFRSSRYGMTTPSTRISDTILPSSMMLIAIAERDDNDIEQDDIPLCLERSLNSLSLQSTNSLLSAASSSSSSSSSSCGQLSKGNWGSQSHKRDLFSLAYDYDDDDVDQSPPHRRNVIGGLRSSKNSGCESDYSDEDAGDVSGDQYFHQNKKHRRSTNCRDEEEQHLSYNDPSDSWGFFVCQ